METTRARTRGWVLTGVMLGAGWTWALYLAIDLTDRWALVMAVWFVLPLVGGMLLQSSKDRQARALGWGLLGLMGVVLVLVLAAVVVITQSGVLDDSGT